MVFCVLFVQPPTEWSGGVGFVTKDMIERHCPPPAADVQVFTFEIAGVFLWQNYAIVELMFGSVI